MQIPGGSPLQGQRRCERCVELELSTEGSVTSGGRAERHAGRSWRSRSRRHAYTCKIAIEERQLSSRNQACTGSVRIGRIAEVVGWGLRVKTPEFSRQPRSRNG